MAMKSFERYLGVQGEEYHRGRHHLNQTCWNYVNRARIPTVAADINPGAVVLEFGCGKGFNLSGINCAARLGYDVVNVIPPWVQDIKFVNNLDAIEDKSIDDALCFHVLEHVPEPIEVLLQIYRILKQGGKLHLRVPYEYRRRNRWPRFDSERDHHIYAWTPRTIFNLLSTVGFKDILVELKRSGFDRISAVTAEKLRLGYAGYRIIRGLFRLIIPGYEINVIATCPDS